MMFTIITIKPKLVYFDFVFTANASFNSHVFMALTKAHFQTFYPGVTLLCCSGKASLEHLLRDEVENVSVAGTVF